MEGGGKKEEKEKRRRRSHTWVHGATSVGHEAKVINHHHNTNRDRDQGGHMGVLVGLGDIGGEQHSQDKKEGTCSYQNRSQ